MADEIKTEQQIVNDCNELARKIHQAQGWICPDDFKFYEDRRSRVRGAWEVAVLAYEHIEGTDVEDALRSLEDEGDE